MNLPLTYNFCKTNKIALINEANTSILHTCGSLKPSVLSSIENLLLDKIEKKKHTDDEFETTLTVVDPTADRTITLPNETGTVLTTGNSDTPTTTTSSSDADFVLVDDGGTMKKITPSNLGITAGAASLDDATALAIALG